MSESANEKYSKSIRKIIFGIIIMAFGFCSKWLMQDLKVIDFINELSLKYLGGIISPLITIGLTVIGGIKFIKGLVKSKKYKKQIQEEYSILVENNKELKEQIEELKRDKTSSISNTKKILKDVKKSLVNEQNHSSIEEEQEEIKVKIR